MRSAFDTFNTNTVTTPTAPFNPEWVAIQDDYCAIDMNEQGQRHNINIQPRFTRTS